jgi:hypothetical protein
MNVVQEIKTHFIFNKLFLETRAVCEIMWKNVVCGRGRWPATDKNKAHARYMLDN